MKRSLLLISLFAILFSSPVMAQDKKEMPPGMPDMMKKMMDLMTPDDHHKKLNTFVGLWDVTSAVPMAPGASPQTSKGSAEYKWVLGGRYLIQEYTGSMMGMTIHGIGYIGYDKSQKKYVQCWMDEMGTAITFSDGNFDQSGKTLTMYGKMDDPATGEYGKNYKYVTTWIDDNSFSFIIYDLTAGDDVKSMVMTFTKKK